MLSIAQVLQKRLGSELAPYPIPEGCVRKEAITGKGKREALCRFVTLSIFSGKIIGGRRRDAAGAVGRGASRRGSDPEAHEIISIAVE